MRRAEGMIDYFRVGRWTVTPRRSPSLNTRVDCAVGEGYIPFSFRFMVRVAAGAFVRSTAAPWGYHAYRTQTFGRDRPADGGLGRRCRVGRVGLGPGAVAAAPAAGPACRP